MGGGKRSREKGNRREREVVALLRGLGLEASRVPLSGAAGGDYEGDVRAALPGYSTPQTIEVKARANAAGWQTIKKWMGDQCLLLLIEDRMPPLVVMSWEAFERMVDRASVANAFDPP